MPTLSEIKAKLIMIKSKIFSFSTRQKEADSKSIEYLYFISTSEEDIFTKLRNKWTNHSWLFLATSTILGIIYAAKNILS